MFKRLVQCAVTIAEGCNGRINNQSTMTITPGAAKKSPPDTIPDNKKLGCNSKTSFSRIN
jgi:hypothetical protein